MNAIPTIPDAVRTLLDLDAWIDAHAPDRMALADRCRIAVAVMDRAVEIGERQRAQAPVAR